MKRILPIIYLVLAGVAGCLMAGCRSRIPDAVPVQSSHYKDGAVLSTDPSSVPPYVIGIGDALRVTVLRHPELSGSVVVGSYGEIRLPDTEDVIIAANRTIDTLEQELAAVVSKYTKTEPVIVASIEVFNSKFIYVLGAVAEPGKYALKDKAVTLRDAIFLAGMPVRDAELRKLVVVNPAFEDPLATKINFEEIYYGGRMKYNVVLNEGDIVFVPYTSFSKTMASLDRIATPLGKAATGLSSYLYIKSELDGE